MVGSVKDSISYLDIYPLIIKSINSLSYILFIQAYLLINDDKGDKMKHKKSFILILKKNFLAVIFTLFLIFLVLFSKTNLYAAKNGLTLWAKNVVPSLLPFFIATELLNYTNIPYYLGKLTNKLMRPFFNVPRRRKLCFYNGNYKWIPCWSQDY